MVTPKCFYLPLAQLDSALGYELRGWAFESLRADHLKLAGLVLVVTRDLAKVQLRVRSSHPAPHIMYRIYYTDPKLIHQAKWQDVSELPNVLQCMEYLRSHGMIYVTMVSDYHNMTGLPGAKMAGTEYVPQLKN